MTVRSYHLNLNCNGIKLIGRKKNLTELCFTKLELSDFCYPVTHCSAVHYFECVNSFLVYNAHISRKFYPFCNQCIYGERGEFFRDRAVVYASVCPSTYGMHIHTGIHVHTYTYIPCVSTVPAPR